MTIKEIFVKQDPMKESSGLNNQGQNFLNIGTKDQSGFENNSMRSQNFESSNFIYLTFYREKPEQKCD